jgi:hypothetical protein
MRRPYPALGRSATRKRNGKVHSLDSFNVVTPIKVKLRRVHLFTWRRGNGNKRSASHPACLSPVEKKTGNPFIRILGGPKA